MIQIIQYYINTLELLQLFVSKEFARFQGYSTMQEAVVGLRSKTKQE